MKIFKLALGSLIIVVSMVFVVCCLFFTLGGCGSSGGSGGSSSSSIAFYSTAKDTTPVFVPTVQITTQSTWGSGNAIYQLFYVLREYIASRDEGIIDRANIYKLLTDVDSIFSSLQNTAIPLATPKIITPPFNFGNYVTYESTNNNTNDERGIALKETSSQINAIATWIWREPNLNPKKMEVGIMETTYNKSSGDITVDFVFSVDYNTDDTICDYNNRTRISGNPSTHAFEFSQSIGGSNESMGLSQLVGKGISQGAVNHFLFKVKNNNDQYFHTTKYIVISAEATEATLKAIDPSTEAITDPDLLPTSVSSYKDYVGTTDFFEFSDLLTDLSTLNQGNTKEGTIYLDY